MAHRVVYEHAEPVRDPDGHTYRARVLGSAREDGTWIGWIEFEPTGSGGLSRLTDRETTQPNAKALGYWAKGLAHVYFEGALERAIRRAPEDVPR